MSKLKYVSGKIADESARLALARYWSQLVAKSGLTSRALARRAGVNDIDLNSTIGGYATQYRVACKILLALNIPPDDSQHLEIIKLTVAARYGVTVEPRLFNKIYTAADSPLTVRLCDLMAARGWRADELAGRAGLPYSLVRMCLRGKGVSRKTLVQLLTAGLGLTAGDAQYAEVMSLAARRELPPCGGYLRKLFAAAKISKSELTRRAGLSRVMINCYLRGQYFDLATVKKIIGDGLGLAPGDLEYQRALQLAALSGYALTASQKIGSIGNPAPRKNSGMSWAGIDWSESVPSIAARTGHKLNAVYSARRRYAPDLCGSKRSQKSTGLMPAMRNAMPHMPPRFGVRDLRAWLLANTAQRPTSQQLSATLWLLKLGGLVRTAQAGRGRHGAIYELAAASKAKS